MKYLLVGLTRGRGRILAHFVHALWKPSVFSARTWEKLGLAWTCLILCVTTMPWSNFVGHSHWQNVRWVPFAEACLKLWFAVDVIGNILLFVPLGWCVIHAQPFRWRNPLRWMAFVGAAFSLSVEFFQIFCHNRSPAMSDVCTNTLGAVLGALLAVRRQRSEGRNRTRNEDHNPLDQAA